ncbi:hypothetical protein B0A54_17974, partial [Friedmanniomyces endolithicus]
MAPSPTHSRESYTVGIICALDVEKAAVEATLDEEHGGLERLAGDDSSYSFGRIGQHDVVVACLPAGVTGKASRQLAQSNKKEPTIWKYKEGKLNGSGYIWTLPDAEQSAEGVAAPQSPHDASKRSPKRDGIVASDEEVQAVAPHSPDGPHPDSAPDTSVSSILVPSRTNISDIPTTRAECDSGSSEAGVAPTQKTPREGQSTVAVGPAHSTLEVEALTKEDTQRLPGVTSISATDQEILNTSVFTYARKPNGNGTTAAPHDVAIVAGPENRGHLQDDACMSESRQQLYFGKLVMQLRSLRHKREQLKQEVESNRNTLPDIPALKSNADQMQKRAQELAQQAEEARQEADVACRDLAGAQDEAKKVDSAEG